MASMSIEGIYSQFNKEKFKKEFEALIEGLVNVTDGVSQHNFQDGKEFFKVVEKLEDQALDKIAILAVNGLLASQNREETLNIITELWDERLIGESHHYQDIDESPLNEFNKKKLLEKIILRVLQTVKSQS